MWKLHWQHSAKDRKPFCFSYIQVFPKLNLWKNLENHYDDFSTCKQVVTICRISVKPPCHETFNNYYETHFEIWFNSTFDTFQMFHSKVLVKLDFDRNFARLKLERIVEKSTNDYLYECLALVLCNRNYKTKSWKDQNVESCIANPCLANMLYPLARWRTFTISSPLAKISAQNSLFTSKYLHSFLVVKR